MLFILFHLTLRLINTAAVRGSANSVHVYRSHAKDSILMQLHVQEIIVFFSFLKAIIR